MKREDLPPGPPGTGIIGSFPFGTRNPLDVLSEWARRYGDIFYYRAFITRVFFLNHPSLVESVLVTNSRSFIKGRGLQVNRRLFGRGLLTSEGELWRRQRKLCQPSFHREHIDVYGGVMTRYAQRALDRWRDGDAFDLHNEAMRLTLQIAAHALFGAEVGGMLDEAERALAPIMEFNTRGRILVPMLRYLPTPRSVRYRLAVRRLERVVHAILHAPDAPGKDTLLFVLRRARREDGMSARQLRDEVMTLLLAGHETTALALAWTFVLLARNPEVETRLAAEIQNGLGGLPPLASDLPRLPFTARVVKESLRLYPPAYAMARVAMEDCTVGGYRIPRGASVVMSQWITHRDPRFFERPEEFLPDRWTEEFSRQLPNFVYFPFGGGPRVCIGASFATTEVTLLLASILQRFRVEVIDPDAVRPLPAITLRPEGGVRVIVHKR
ncbi:MAG: cytochrome P450 [Terriglobia bacterium]